MVAETPACGRLPDTGIDAGLAFGFDHLCYPLFALGLVQGKDFVGGFLQPISAVAQFFMGAAALFAGVAGQFDTVYGDELDVAGTGLPNAAAGDQTLALGQQYDLESDTRVIGGTTHFIVLELGIQRRQIKLVAYQIVQR